MTFAWPDLTRVEPALAEQLPSLGDAVTAALQDVTPVGKGETAGRLRDSLTPQVDGLTLTVTSGVPEAAFVLFGTRPHPIDPQHEFINRAGKSQRGYLSWEGAKHPVGHVEHPGTAPNDFPTEAEGAIDEAAQTAMDAAVAEALG